MQIERRAPRCAAWWKASSCFFALTALAPASPCQGTTREFYLYDDLPIAVWSGFMGTDNGASIALDLRATDSPAEGVYHARMTFGAQVEWTGIYLQSAPNAWFGPGPDLSGSEIVLALRSSLQNQAVYLSAFDDQIVNQMEIVQPAWSTKHIDVSASNGTEIHNIVAIVVHDPVPGSYVDVDAVRLRVNRPNQSPASVSIAGSSGSFELLVDQRPFSVRGVGYDSIESAHHAEDMALIRAMGANTLRTWAPLDSTFALLDAAQAEGLRVLPAFWLARGDGGEVVDYADPTYRQAVKNSLAHWIACFRDHPSVLCWSLGNEVYEQLPPAQHGAFTTLLDQLAIGAHAADPHHPVTYAAAGLQASAQVLSTSIDLYGANSYAGLPSLLKDYAEASYSKPLLLTEFGCDGWWETDWSQYPDTARAADYAARALMLRLARGTALGGCAFAWIDKSESGHTGWGLVNDDRTLRPQYRALARVWSAASAGG